MAVLAAILPIVSRSSALALHLYRLAAVENEAATALLTTAKSINNVSLIVKQVGTIIKEDDRLPSSEAFETLEDILDQCTAILSEVEATFPDQNSSEERDHGYPERPRKLRHSSSTVARLHYLTAHLDSLRSTLAVMLQTLYTAQSIMWARVRPTVSPAQCATAVASEKQQLETLIIEQQMAILLACKVYEPLRPDARMLMEHDSSQSLMAIDDDTPQHSRLFKYQDKFIATLDIHNTNEEQWLATVCSVSRSQLDRLLDRWTRLRQFEENLRGEEQKAQAQKWEALQPFVESDNEEEAIPQPIVGGQDERAATPTQHRPGSTQPLFSETTTLPIPVKGNRGDPTAPLSPASSYGTSPMSPGNTLPIPVMARSSNLNLPIEAAAAVEAKDRDDELDLGIPWTLCTRRNYWKYVDGKVESTNTDAKPSEALSDRNSWTEILASWVCKEAIQEVGHQFTQAQKEVRDGRRTRFETCFCIQQPLNFQQVQKLVEKTVEIYRESKPPTPPARQPRRSSFERRSHDRDKTPIANGHAPLDRTYGFPPPPPPLDRASSMPGSGNPRTSDLHLPTMQSPGTAPYPSQPGQYPPQQSSIYALPQILYPPPPPPSGSLDPRQIQSPIHVQPNMYPPPPPPPPNFASAPPSHLRNSFADYERNKPQHLRTDHYSSTSGTSDSDSVPRPRKSRTRSKNRKRDGGSGDRRKKKEGGHSGATKAMMGVAGLTALLDGLVGI